MSCFTRITPGLLHSGVLVGTPGPTDSRASSSKAPPTSGRHRPHARAVSSLGVRPRADGQLTPYPSPTTNLHQRHGLESRTMSGAPGIDAVLRALAPHG